MKARKLDFAMELSLPIDMATETFGFLGKKGKGKTYGAQKLFELLHAAGVQCVALDPVGNWWSLRVGKDGKSPGLPVYVFGGPRGDVPILPDAGAFVARVIVEKGVSVILDVSRFRKAERKRFMTAFAEEFFQLKKDAVSPVHLFVEEAHKFVPQLIRDGEEQMLGAMEDIIRIGRNYGIGASLISQRSASVNKDVLGQVECLLAYQTSGRHDKKAIVDWVEENDEEGTSLLAELKSLQRGEALFWSPSALRTFKKIHVLEKVTLDASSTPKVGSKTRKPVKLAKVDLEGIHEAMKEVVASAEANDIGALKKKLAEKTKMLAALEERHMELGKAAGVNVILPMKDCIPVINPRQVSRLEKIAVRFEKGTERLDKMRDRLAQSQQAVVSEVGNMTTMMRQAMEKTAAWNTRGEKLTSLPKELVNEARKMAMQQRPKIGAPPLPPRKKPELVKTPNQEDVRLDGPMRRVLWALAWFEAIGIAQPSATAVAFMSEYRGENGAFNNVRGKLRSSGLVAYLTPGTVSLTDEGRQVAPPVAQPENNDELLDAVMARLDGPQKRVLQPLIDAYPSTVATPDLATVSGYGSVNGAFNNVRGRLRTLGLATYPSPGTVRAADLLFLR